LLIEGFIKIIAMKRFLLFSGLLLFLLRAEAAPRGEDLLRAMMNAERTVSYSATETMTSLDGPTIVAKVQRKGIKRRVEYSAPPIMRGDLQVDDGKIVWRFHKSENSAIKTQTTGRRSTRDVEAMRRRFDAKTQGQTIVANRKAWVVAVTPKGKSQVLRKFWVDDQTKIRLRAEMLDGRGQRVETRALSNVKIGHVPDAAFRFILPRGADVTNAGTLYTQLGQARRSTPWLRLPTNLPRGYAFESAVVDEKKNESWLRYTNGIRRFSIFQQHTDSNASKELARAGEGWYWQKSGNRFLIAGLTEAQAKLVAQSVK
jgi:outer membrane lipoprotein-sorting protein